MSNLSAVALVCCTHENLKSWTYAADISTPSRRNADGQRFPCQSALVAYPRATTLVVASLFSVACLSLSSELRGFRDAAFS